MAGLLFHIIGSREWDAARDRGTVRPAQDAAPFVHCSTAAQVADVANWWFRGRDDLVLLALDAERIDAAITYEVSALGRRFPHVDGFVPLNAVVMAVSWSPDSTGRFRMPAELNDLIEERLGDFRFSWDTDSIRVEQLAGDFFEGWPRRPDAAEHLRILRDSAHALVAMEAGRAVGFVTALSDGGFAASIPLVEVIAIHRRRGVGTELVRRMLDALRDHTVVDVLCDERLVGFWSQFGMIQVVGMARRELGIEAPPGTRST